MFFVITNDEIPCRFFGQFFHSWRNHLQLGEYWWMFWLSYGTDVSLSRFCLCFQDILYPKKYAHGFVVLCFVVVMQSFIMNSHEVFIHIHQGCFAGTGAIVKLPHCKWSKPDGYGKISQCITTTKHSKAKTVCIFLGIYCIHVKFHSGLKCMPIKMLYIWTYEHNKYIPSDIYTGISMCHRIGFLKVLSSSCPFGMILTLQYHNLNRLDNIHVRQCCGCVAEMMLIQYVCDIPLVHFASTILKNGVNNRT